MSLMMGACCCGCTTTATCNCLPSSYQMTFQSFTVVLGVGTYTLPAQTVTAYKCCFAYDSGDGYGVQNRIVYRPSLINIGTYLNNNCSPSITVPIYFLIYFGINLNNNIEYNPCVIEMNYALISPDLDTNTCSLCLITPSVIDANTSCHFVGTNETCYDNNGNLYINTFMQYIGNSYFDDCACPTYNASDTCCVGLQWFAFDSGDTLLHGQDNQCDLINVNGGLGYVSSFVGSGVPVVFVLS
jgi:hypothetical protein